MKISVFPVNPFQMNFYICYDEFSGEGVLIDPGVYEEFEKQECLKFLEDENIRIKYILNTHGHLDHILGNRWATENFAVPLLMHKDDLPLTMQAVQQGQMFGVSFPEPPIPDDYLDEHSEIWIGENVLNVIHTPGHSPGSICFVNVKDKFIIAGDVIFKRSIGRTDLWRGDMNILLNSIFEKVFSYSDDYMLYPGHMDPTTIGDEKRENPFLRRG